jgi:hypothetical protein
MKLLHREEFLKLEDVLFCKYEPYTFDSLLIKGETRPYDDFYYKKLFTLKESEEDDPSDSYILANESFEESKEGLIDLDSWYRDGLYDKDQLFVVFDKIEVINISNQLLSLKN